MRANQLERKNVSIPGVFRRRRAKPAFFSTIAAAALLMVGTAQAQGLVSPCTGISLPASSVFNFLNPVLGPTIGAVDTLTGGLLGLGNTYTGLANGAPLGLNVLDTQGNILSPNDGCRLTSDGYSLNDARGVAIGANSITGLGTRGAATPVAFETSAIALGDGASTAPGAINALALGTNAAVVGAGDGAIALGAGSTAGGPLAAPYLPVGGTYPVSGTTATPGRELSIGTAGAERRITNVAAGGADTDVANISQLRSVASLIDGAVAYDSVTRDTVTLAGAAGTRLTNVAAGTLDPASTDAVNGAQLFATNQNVTNNTTNLTNLTTRIDNGTIGLVQQVGSATGPLTVGGATGGGVVDFTGTAGARVLTGIAAGSTPTDAVNFGQLAAIGAVATNSVQYDDSSRSVATLGGAVSTDGGATGGTRLANVGQGALAATSADAVNGAQLFATNQAVVIQGSQIGGLATSLGGGAQVNPDGTLTGPVYTLPGVGAGGTSTNGTYTNVGDALGALGGSVVNLNQAVNNIVTTSGSKFIQVNSTGPAAAATGADGVAIGSGAQSSGASAVSLGDAALATGTGGLALGASSQATSDGGVALGAGAVASRAGLAGAREAVSNVAVGSAQGAVSVGAAGAERQITNVAGGTQATDAVNVRQLQAVQAVGVGYAMNADGSVNYQQVVLGNAQAPGGTVVSNVAPGVSAGDAVNVQQLNAGVAAGIGQANQYTDARLGQLQSGMQDVARKAYAGVAAAMALESAPYVAGKVTYAAGLGHYQSQSAVGVSLRRTDVSGRWSVTGGVSATGAGGAAVRVGVAGVFD